MLNRLRKNCSCEKSRSGRFKKWGEGHGGVNKEVEEQQFEKNAKKSQLYDVNATRLPSGR